MNSAATFQFNWNGFSPAAGFSRPVIDFQIERAVDGLVVASGTGDNTFTSMLLAAGNLQPGTTYVASLLYGNGTWPSDSGFDSADSYIDFARSTDLTFTTRVPEPSSLVLLLVGGGGLMGWLVKRRCKSRPV